MKELSGITKAAFAVLALLALLVYALVVEWGMSAGQVHSGVTVAGYDVAGLTFDEVREALAERRSLLRDEEICFENPEFNQCISPEALGWFPDIGPTAEEAYGVGRQGDLLSDIGDRITAYRKGYNVPWAGHPRPRLVTELIDEWERELRALGYTLDRGKLRYKIRRAITTHPRRNLRFPVTQS